MSTHDHDDQYMLLSGRNILTKTDKYRTDNQTNTRPIPNSSHVNSRSWRSIALEIYVTLREKYIEEKKTDKYRTDNQTNITNLNRGCWYLTNVWLPKNTSAAQYWKSKSMPWKRFAWNYWRPKVNTNFDSVWNNCLGKRQHTVAMKQTLDLV